MKIRCVWEHNGDDSILHLYTVENTKKELKERCV